MSVNKSLTRKKRLWKALGVLAFLAVGVILLANMPSPIQPAPIQLTTNPAFDLVSVSALYMP